MPFGFSGVVLAAKGGEIVLHKAYGLADRTQRVPLTTESIFDIASVTKLFTRAAILDLVRQGKLRASDSLGSLLPDVPADKRGITIQQLLDHKAGLHPFLADAAEDYAPITRDAMVQALLARPLRSAPGARESYSNPGYGLLAVIIERVSGESYEGYLRRHLFLPAGMMSTGYVLAAWDRRRLAIGYRGVEAWGTPLDQPWAADGPWWGLRGAGGMLSTAGDLYRWVRARALIGDAEDGVFAGSNRVFYAAVVRRRDADVILLSNARNDPDGVSRNEPARVLSELLDDLLLGAEIPMPPAPATTDGETLRRVAGVYESPAGDQIEVRAFDDHLLVLDRHLALGRLLAPITQPGQDSATLARRSQVERLITAVASGNVDALAERLWRSINMDEERAYWRTTWPAWERTYGRYAAPDVLGSTVRGDTLDTFVSLRFERGDRVVRIRTNRAGHYFIDTSPVSMFSSLTRLVPTSDTTFAAYDFLARRASRVMIVVGTDGAARGLRVGDLPNAPMLHRRH